MATITSASNPTLECPSKESTLKLKGTDGRREFTDLIRPDLHNYCPASNLAFNEKIKKLMSEGEEIYHFAFGQAPFPVVPCMVRALQEHAGEKAYLPVAGIPELRKAIVKFHQRHDNLADIDEDRVIVGPGTKELIFLLMNVFHGDILVVSPAWTTYKPQSQLAHHKAYEINTSMDQNWKITPDAVERTLKENNAGSGNKLLILCNPCNPSGTCYTAEDLAALSDVFRKNNIIVLCDEIYARLHYGGNHESLVKHYPEGSILSSGMSKWASAGGWRVGYNIFPKELETLKDAVKSAASHTYSCCSAPMQYAVAKGLNQEEDVDSYIKHTTRIMAAVGDYCYRELTSVGVKAIPPTGGYYIFPDFEILRDVFTKRGITTCEQMCQALLNEANVAVMAGGPAFLRPIDEFTVRLCYVNFDGAEGLAFSEQIGLENPLPEDFVQKYCAPAYKGIKAIQTWVKNQLA